MDFEWIEIIKWLKNNWRKYLPWLAGAAVLLIIALVGLTKFQTQPTTFPEAVEKQTPSADSVPAKKKKLFVVDVKGAVKRPGVYRLPSSQCLQDAIRKAGGPTEEAELKELNLAVRIRDESVVYVPKRGEQIPERYQQTEQSNLSQSGSSSSNQLNLNQASLTELQTLNGVGPKKAQQILNYRQAHGSFKTIGELQKVDGFGEKTVSSLKEFVTI